MKQSSLGRTGLQISELVFGGGFVGGILLHASDVVRRDAIQLAIQAGINWIDTAASYGNGQSEEVVGWLLSELPDKERPQVSTKFRVDPNGDDYTGQIRRSLDQSLRRLQMTSVPLVQLHNQLGSGDQQLPLNEVMRSDGVLDALDRIRAEGLTDFIGFTALGDASACRAVVESGRVDTAQVYYNLINPSAGFDIEGHWHSDDYTGLLAACQQFNVGVLGIRVYAAGILASRVQHGREIPVTRNSDYDSELRRADMAREVLAEMVGSDAQKALRFVLDQDAIHGAVIGLAELSHLQEAIQATQMGPLSSSVTKALKDLWSRDYR
ncbi:MAG: aldo/keto reductase [Arenicellales bacterium]|jgi:L-galactose dehydrogenase/L-glyceraldehyde 3-phosphate reductase|nr:aldo/keto reductase [Arenicellales bacterium]MDP7616507.1 aldo/keto reductase [Arenicellales bacterium]